MSEVFQISYVQFLRPNGVDGCGMIKGKEYQEVLKQQTIFGNELLLFSKKEMQKEIRVPKPNHEPLGVVIVESGWGSMIPTVVIASMAPNGPAAKCGYLNIGDQIISINGVSLVGLSLSTCQHRIKTARHREDVKLGVIPCPPVLEVCIRRPETKYQMGFSVKDGVIYSLLRGGIAERGGVRVGHRIIEVNGTSVVAVPYDKITDMLLASVGDIHMKTMQAAIFDLLTGQELPHYI